MPIKLIILGTGGNCLDILDAVLAINQRAGGNPAYEIIGFLDDDPALQSREVGGWPVLGTLTQAGRFPDCQFINGIGSPASFWRKEEILRQTGIPTGQFATILHPMAWVSTMARLGNGCAVLGNAFIGARAVVGNHVIVLATAVINHDCRVGDYACIASGACLAGGVEVAPLSYVGSNATVRGGVKISPRALVGMGSVVVKDVPEGAVVAGNPARLLRPTQAAP